jgi:SNF2 family DNA or RNA helicase
MFNNLTDEYPKVTQPKGMKIKLKPHQLTSIAAMRELETEGKIIIDQPDDHAPISYEMRYVVRDPDEVRNSTFIIQTNSAILADRVGAGKTYEIIGLIMVENVPVRRERVINGTDNYSIKMISSKETTNINLIVVPHGLALQWAQFMNNAALPYLLFNRADSFDRFYDIDEVDKRSEADMLKGCHFKCKVSRTKGKAMKVTYRRYTLNQEAVQEAIDNNTVFILNVNRYKDFRRVFPHHQWARVIIDEMDSAKLPTDFNEFGNFNWFLTATPTGIFNKSSRSYATKIFKSSGQSLLTYFTVKNTEDYVNASVVLPKPYVYFVEVAMNVLAAAVKDMVPADVLKLINAGNMQEAIQKLNCDVDTEDNIMDVMTAKLKKELHNMKVKLSAEEKMDPIDENKVKTLKSDISRCQTKLNTIIERIESIKTECCFICSDEFESPTIIDCCKTVSCLKCLVQALAKGNNMCPYCRHQVKSPKEYHVVGASEKKPKKEVAKNSPAKPFGKMEKMDVLAEILKYIAENTDNPRILIFSDYAQSFNKIANMLNESGLKHSTISGTPQRVAGVLDDYRNGRLNVLMLDSEHYGSGHNLQDAEYLILLHRMKPETEVQVIGRGQRFGRKSALKIIYLVNETENKATTETKEPMQLEGMDDLWLVTDPPKHENENIELIDEQYEAYKEANGNADADLPVDEDSGDETDASDNESDEDDVIDNIIGRPKKSAKTARAAPKKNAKATIADAVRAKTAAKKAVKAAPKKVVARKTKRVINV